MDIRGFEVVSAFEEQDINLPTRKTTESAGYDIECAEAVTLEPGQVVLVPTGLKPSWRTTNTLLFIFVLAWLLNAILHL